MILSGSGEQAGRVAAGLRHRRAAAGRDTATITAEGSKIVNAIVVRGRDQVMLKVTVAEVQRDVIKQLGIDLDGALSFGASVINLAPATHSRRVGQPLSDSNVSGTFKPSPPRCAPWIAPA